MRRLTGCLGVLAAVALIVPAVATADLGSEVQQGQRLADSIRSGQMKCSDLTAADFELIGEYAMDQFIGNRAAHEAMNAHMVQMMGPQGERRMHVALGYRYTRCAGAPPSSWLGPMAGMMGGYRGGYPGGRGPGMMGRPNGGQGGFFYGPMMGGRLSRGSQEGSDLSGAAIAALAFGAAVLGSLVVVLALYLRGRRPGAAS